MFKDGYQKEMNGIKPRKAFIDDLAEKMNEEETAVSKSKPTYMNWYYGTLVATLLICLVGGFSVFYVNSSKQDHVMNMQAGVAHDATQQDFESDTWYGAETKSKVKYQTMMDKINADKDIVIFASKTNTFLDSDALNELDKDALFTALGSAAYMNDEEMDSENVKYYLLKFSDGTTISFEIYDDIYFYNDEIGSTFKLKD